MKIYLVTRVFEINEGSVFTPIKAFYDYVHAQDFADRQDEKLTPVQFLYITFEVDEIDLVEND